MKLTKNHLLMPEIRSANDISEGTAIPRNTTCTCGDADPALGTYTVCHGAL